MNEPVGYMQRTKEFYAAQGYEKSYVWAQHRDIPFTPLSKPLAQSRLGIVTTAALYDRKPLEPREVASAPMEPPPERLYANDLAWAKESTHMDDRASYFPIEMLREMVAEQRLGALAERFHCIPTSYSQRATLEQDAPDVLSRLQADEVDVALLIPL